MKIGIFFFNQNFKSRARTDARRLWTAPHWSLAFIIILRAHKIPIKIRVKINRCRTTRVYINMRFVPSEFINAYDGKKNKIKYIPPFMI